MIKNYSNFISEKYEGFDTLAEYIEHLAKDNEYALHVISEYTQDINKDVRLANAINSLDERTQKVILDLILNQNIETRGKDGISVTSYTSTTYNESQQLAGKNIFKCFLKVISALGQKEIQIDWKKCSDEYLSIFVTDHVNFDQMLSVMSRYLYFDNFLKIHNSKTNFTKLYFGVKNNLNIEYGVILNEEKIVLGSFLLTQGTYNFIMTLDLKSSTNLKRFLVSFDLPKLNILSKVKNFMKDYFPGQTDNKLEPTINGDIISYGFQGLGKWDNGQIDIGEIDNIKNNLRSSLIQQKWSDKVQFNLSPSDGWVFINFKIK